MNTSTVKYYEEISKRALRAYDYMANPDIPIEEKHKRFDAYDNAFAPIKYLIDSLNCEKKYEFTQWFLSKCGDIDIKYR